MKTVLLVVAVLVSTLSFTGLAQANVGNHPLRELLLEVEPDLTTTANKDALDDLVMAFCCEPSDVSELDLEGMLVEEELPSMVRQ